MAFEDQASGLRERVAERRRSEPEPGGGLRCIAVGSGKGGVGKTMVSVGLGFNLRARGQKVLIVDADMGLANVDLQVGMEPRYTLQDIVFGKVSMENAVIRVPKGPDILAAASGAQEMVEMGGARRRMLVDELVSFASSYDYMIVDVAAGIGQNVTTFLAAAPEALVVVAHEPTSLMDAYALIKTVARNERPPVMSLVLNMVSSAAEGHRLAASINSITTRFLGRELPVAGIIPYDSQVRQAIRARRAVPVFSPRAAAACALEDLAREVSSGRHYMRVGSGSRKPVFEHLLGFDGSGGEDV